MTTGSSAGGGAVPRSDEGGGGDANGDGAGESAGAGDGVEAGDGAGAGNAPRGTGRGRPCPRCETPMYHRHCKYVCPDHGVVYDCSDTFY